MKAKIELYREIAKSVMVECELLNAKIAELHSVPGGELLLEHQREVHRIINEVRDLIRRTMPKETCPECAGNPQDSLSPLGCDVCNGRGWLRS